MSNRGTNRWAFLESVRATAFLLGGVIFVANTALVAYNVVVGAEGPLILGQAFVGAGWTAAFIGLLGVYPSLAARSRWPARVGAVFAVIGAITMAAMSVTSLGYVAGVLRGEFSQVVGVFLPGVFLGIILGFGTFGLTSLRSDVVTRNLGLLFLVLPLTFLFNLGTGIAGFNPLSKVLVVVGVLALTMLAIGYLFRTGGALENRQEMETSSSSGA